MILTEIISGTLEKYDYSSNSWVQVMTISNANVIRADSQRQCTNDDSFMIGGCFSATLNITLEIPPPMTKFQVMGCRLALVSSLAGNIGVFWVTNASRKGRIFTLNCHDAIIWTETSSYCRTLNSLANSVISMFPDDYSTYLQGWMDGERLTGYTNQFIQYATGYRNLLGFDLYHLNENQGFDVCNYDVQISIAMDSGKADTDCPRDVYKMLAEMSFGFVYADPDSDGHLTLGQFAEPRFGTAEIFANEIEYDSAEFADYRCMLQRVSAVATGADGIKDSYSQTLSSPDYSQYSYFGITVEDNPFLDRSYQLEIAKGHQARLFLRQIAENMYDNFHRSSHAFAVRPFKCTVHGAHNFHLGQKALIHYLEYDGTIKNHDSIITKICWSLNGGQTIMCCGGDSRTLSETLVFSKGDRVRKDVQNHCDAIKRRTVGLSQAEYDALTDKDDHTLYCII